MTRTTLGLGLLATLAMALLPRSARCDEPAWPPPFFAFDNGTGRGEVPPAEQAQLLADLGYAGIGYTGTHDIPAMLKALESRGLKMFSTYVKASVGPSGPEVEPGLDQAITQLAGRGTAIWLYIQGKRDAEPSYDDQAVALIRDIASKAQEAGLPVVLYPHVGFYVERVDQAVHLAQQVDRPNVGVAFNLCHFLKLQDQHELDATLDLARPYLRLVSINGADPDPTAGWDRLIQPLDSGSFDLAAFLAGLKARGYRGPIGLQCYALKEPSQNHLARSIAAWTQLQSQLSP